MQAMAQLIAHKEAQKDEQHAAVVAAKDAEIERLKAQLGGGV